MSDQTGAFTAWALIAVVVLLRRWRRTRRAGRSFLPARVALARRTALGLVVGIAATVVFLPVVLGSSAAYADGFDCKEAPAAEMGNTWGDFVDSDAEQAARGDGSDYGTYGWAGLKWSTYDLGCGPDVTRAPGAVFDTSAGNFGLNLSKGMAGTAIWLDRQTRTDYETGGGASSVLGKFDQLVTSGSAALKSAFYDQWIAVSFMVVGIVVLTAALRGRAASAMRATLVGAAALFLAALAVGAPQTATKAVDQQFTGAVGDVQGRALQQIGVDPKTGPRDVVITQIIERQWRAGWFGDPDSPIAAQNAAKLRDALAFSYADVDELNEIKNNPGAGGVAGTNAFARYIAAYRKVIGPKKDEFTAIASDMQKDSADSYGQFIGKDSGRMNSGFIAAVETFSATGLWIAASLLKLLGLLIVRLAILFAPIWVPLAMISESLLMTIVRFIGSALFWAVAASAAVAAHLIVLTKLFDPKLGLSDGWRVFMLVIVTAVLWMVLRPFKRLTQFAGMNVNATARGAWQRTRHGTAVTGGLVGGVVGGGVGWLAARNRVGSRDEGQPRVTVIAQEGTRRPASSASAATRSGPRAVETRSRPALPMAGPAGDVPSTASPGVLPSAQPRAAISQGVEPSGVRVLGSDEPAAVARSAPVFERDGELVYDLYTPSTGRYSRPVRDRSDELVGV